jgi:hypothetical protein
VRHSVLCFVNAALFCGVAIAVAVFLCAVSPASIIGCLCSLSCSGAGVGAGQFLLFSHF